MTVPASICSSIRTKLTSYFGPLLHARCPFPCLHIKLPFALCSLLFTFSFRTTYVVRVLCASRRFSRAFYENSSAKRALFSRSLIRFTPRRVSTLPRHTTTLLLRPRLTRPSRRTVPLMPALSRAATRPMNMVGRPCHRLTRASKSLQMDSHWARTLPLLLVSRFMRQFRCPIKTPFSPLILDPSIGRLTQCKLCIIVIHRLHRHSLSLCLIHRCLWRHLSKLPNRTSFLPSVPLRATLNLCLRFRHQASCSTTLSLPKLPVNPRRNSRVRCSLRRRDPFRDLAPILRLRRPSRLARLAAGRCKRALVSFPPIRQYSLRCLYGLWLILFYRDTISSHEKKRHYLECLEHYVVYLHDQLKLIGAQPVALERVPNYRGLSSRSIRVCINVIIFER